MSPIVRQAKLRKAFSSLQKHNAEPVINMICNHLKTYMAMLVVGLGHSPREKYKQRCSNKSWTDETVLTK